MRSGGQCKLSQYAHPVGPGNPRKIWFFEHFGTSKMTSKLLSDNLYYQRVCIARYAKRWYSQRRNVRLSVCLCPSVRPSDTLRYCIKTKKASVMIFSASESLNILVSKDIWVITKFDRGHPERWRSLRLGWVRTGDFGDSSPDNPPNLRNGARSNQVCYWPLIANHIRAFDWYQNHRPWMTLNWPWTAIMRSFALHTSLGAQHKNLNEDRTILSATQMLPRHRSF